MNQNYNMTAKRIFNFLGFKKLIDANKCISILISFFILNSVAYADNVDEFILAKMKEIGIPGLQVAIVQHKKIVKVASYGTSNIQESIEVNKDTVFNIASMTKAFTCVAILQLVEQGKLNLNDSISTYLTNLPDSWKRITINQVLSHSSGLPDFMNNRFQLIDSSGESQSWEAVKQSEILFEAGTAFHYNQTNYLVAGQIIQKVSGNVYSDLIKEFQLNKIGMTRTETAGFAHFEDINVNQARDYIINAEGRLVNVLTHFPASIRAGAGMSSTANELAKWSIALQNNVFFENKASLSKLWLEAPLINDNWINNNPNKHPYALGWYMVNRSLNKKFVTVGGGQSALAIYPNDELSIVILTNLAGANPENIMDELAEFYIDDFGLSNNLKLLKKTLDQKGYVEAIKIAKSLNINPKTKYSPIALHHFAELLEKHNKIEQANSIYSLNNQLFSKKTLRNEELSKYLGDYKLPDFSINVSRKGNSLFITATEDATFPIFSDTENRFVLEPINVSINFVEGKNGTINGLILNLNNQELIGERLN